MYKRMLIGAITRNVILLGVVVVWSPFLKTSAHSQLTPAFDSTQVCPPDLPAAPAHIEHASIVAGDLAFEDVFSLGKMWFEAALNTCDGQGRPATTGTGEKRIADEPRFLRTSGADSSSCFGCHAQPRSGGGGDFVANVFVLAQALDPVTESVSSEFSNERNTLGMFGAGPIEMVAREMSRSLQAQAAALPDGEHTLISKGVEFPISISGGKVVAAYGVDTDLVVKPFHQAGVVVSLRQFTVNAFNHHHGIQAEERFDLNPAHLDTDFDEDGIHREMTLGDVTAVTLFQAALAIPTQKLPWTEKARAPIAEAEKLFGEIGCTGCHTPAMELESPYFIEPNPFNPDGTFGDTSQTVSFDMTKEGQLPRLPIASSGKAVVKAYTDLKRHNLCDPADTPDAIRFFCNEEFDQDRPEQDGRPGAEFFLTRKLWDVGNSAPYGHRGDVTTISEAIYYHAGEARLSRDSFVALPMEKQVMIVEFLKTLKVDDVPFDCNGDGKMDSLDLVGIGCFTK